MNLLFVRSFIKDRTWISIAEFFSYGEVCQVLRICLWYCVMFLVRTSLCLQECYLENDQTSLYHTAKGLMTLQALYGTIPQIFGKGECARVSNRSTCDSCTVHQHANLSEVHLSICIDIQVGNRILSILMPLSILLTSPVLYQCSYPFLTVEAVVYAGFNHQQHTSLCGLYYCGGHNGSLEWGTMLSISVLL